MSVKSDSENESGAEHHDRNQDKKIPKKKIPFNTTKHDIKEMYEKRKGKSLYLTFPKKLPTDENVLEKLARTLCSRIIKVRRPRQKNSRSCYVDFNSEEDRYNSLKDLLNVEINGKRLSVVLPKTENSKFVKNIIEKANRSKELKKAKKKLKKEAMKSKKLLTSSLILRNVPQDITMSELHEVFPEAVEIVPGTDKNDVPLVRVQMPTPGSATEIRNKGVKLRGEKLVILYDTRKKDKNENKELKENEHDQNENGNEVEDTEQVVKENNIKRKLKIKDNQNNENSEKKKFKITKTNDKNHEKKKFKTERNNQNIEKTKLKKDFKSNRGGNMKKFKKTSDFRNLKK